MVDFKNEYKFIWEKWNTPTEDYHQSLIYHKPAEDAERLDPDDLEEMVEEAYGEEVYMQDKVPVQLIHAFIEQNKFMESFEFWVLHTNFDLSPEIEKIIQNTEGVESFQKVTRYRAKIGLTKAGLFDNRKVKLDIQDNLTAHLIDSSIQEPSLFQEDGYEVDLSYFDLEIQEEINKAKDDLSVSSNMWSIFVFPNGALSTFMHDSEDEMINKITFLARVKAILGGHILCSDSSNGV